MHPNVHFYYMPEKATGADLKPDMCFGSRISFGNQGY